MPIKAILFDKDGTLLNFAATFAPATEKVLQSLAEGQQESTEKLADIVGFNLTDLTFKPDSVLIAGSLKNIADCLLPHVRRR